MSISTQRYSKYLLVSVVFEQCLSTRDDNLDGKSRFVLILREGRGKIYIFFVRSIIFTIVFESSIGSGWEILCKIWVWRKEDWETLFQRRYLGESVESVGVGFNCLVVG